MHNTLNPEEGLTEEETEAATAQQSWRTEDWKMPPGLMSLSFRVRIQGGGGGVKVWRRFGSWLYSYRTG